MSSTRRPQSGTHESLSRDDDVAPASERSFGIVMGVVFALISAVGVWHARVWWPWTAGIAAVFLALAFCYPAALVWPNRVWFQFGLLLHRIVNPVIMGFLFYATVLPTGLAMRAFGHDPMRLKREPDADSYWIVREPPGPAPETMKDQF